MVKCTLGKCNESYLNQEELAKHIYSKHFGKGDSAVTRNKFNQLTNLWKSKKGLTCEEILAYIENECL